MNYKMINYKNLFILLFIPAFLNAQNVPQEDYLKGLVFYNQEKFDSSIVYFDRTLKQSKMNDNALYYKALSHFKTNDLSNAIIDFTELEKLNKGRGAIYLARIYARMNNLNEVLKYLEIHLQSNYRLPEKEILLDPDLTKFENIPEWKKFWEKGSFYSNLDEILADADYLTNTKNYIDAINVLSEGMKGGYRKNLLYAKRAEVYMKMGNDKLAINDLNMAIEGDKRNAFLFELRGNVQHKLGKYKEALADYESALRLEPDNIKLYPKRALAYSKNGLHDKASADMEFYLSYFKEDSEAWYNYGTINMESGNYFKALECLNKSLAINPNEPRYFFSRGLTYLKTKTYQYAMNDFSMALDLEPDNASAYYQKGLAAVQLGEKSNACFCFERAFHFGLFEAKEQMEKYCSEFYWFIFQISELREFS